MIKGDVFIISSPAGGGKTTLTNMILEEDDKIKRVVTYTTRRKRKNEKDGVDYVFVKKREFKKLIGQDAFLEYAQVHDNYYGTPKKEVFDLLERGYDVVLVIDVQGMRQIKEKIQNAITIFILPPSFEELENRMRMRGETSEEIEKRLQTARKELFAWKDYDYVIVNEYIIEAKEKLKTIINAQRLRRDRFDLNLIKDEKMKKIML